MALQGLGPQMVSVKLTDQVARSSQPSQATLRRRTPPWSSRTRSGSLGAVDSPLRSSLGSSVAWDSTHGAMLPAEKKNMRVSATKTGATGLDVVVRVTLLEGTGIDLEFVMASEEESDYQRALALLSALDARQDTRYLTRPTIYILRKFTGKPSFKPVLRILEVLCQEPLDETECLVLVSTLQKLVEFEEQQPEAASAFLWSISVMLENSSLRADVIHTVGAVAIVAKYYTWGELVAETILVLRGLVQQTVPESTVFAYMLRCRLPQSLCALVDKALLARQHSRTQEWLRPINAYSMFLVSICAQKLEAWYVKRYLKALAHVQATGPQALADALDTVNDADTRSVNVTWEAHIATPMDSHTKGSPTAVM